MSYLHPVSMSYWIVLLSLLSMMLMQRLTLTSAYCTVLPLLRSSAALSSLQHCNRIQAKHVSYAFYSTSRTCLFGKKLAIRPTVDDVERISRGQAAKRRGTGSRGVPHRLNSAERIEWDLAKKRRFLMLRGTGWRRERGDSPLANIYRNYCDAVEVPCISIARAIGIQDLIDHVIIDFSPLRRIDIQDMVTACKSMTTQYSSAQEVQDNTSLQEQGWGGDIQELLENELIYRLPVYSLVIPFSVRAEARRFAEELAIKFANGVKQVVDTSVEDEIERQQQDEEYREENS